MKRRIRASLGLVAAGALVLAACGGGDDDGDDTPPDATGDAGGGSDADDATDDGGDGDDATTDDATTDDGATDDGATGDGGGDASGGGAGGFEPGDVSWRAVNLLDRPVDLITQTQGLVEGFQLATGVAPGEVTDYLVPPTDGSFTVVEVGTSDLSCVADCDGYLADLSAFEGTGPLHTVIVYEDEFSGPTTLDLWELPEGDSGNSNALVPADPATGLVTVVAIALTDADFGLRLGIDGQDGCITNVNLGDSTLIGGTQTPAFAYPGDGADLLLFDNQDRDCAEAPVGGPFTVTGGPGVHSVLVLAGAPGSMDGIVLEVGGDTAPAGDAAGDPGDAGDAGGADGADGAKGELLGLLLDEAAALGIDEACVTDAVDRLSDGDAQIVLDNFDSPDLPSGLTPDGEAALQDLIGCAPGG